MLNISNEMVLLDPWKNPSLAAMPPCKNSKIFIAKNNKGELQIIGILITIVNKPNQNSNHFLITIVLCNENLKILDFFEFFVFFKMYFDHVADCILA